MQTTQAVGVSPTVFTTGRLICRLKLRPRWLVVLTKHLAPRAHERYLLQGIELSEETLARIRTMPRKRPWWLAFLRRQFHRIFPEAED